MAFTAFIYLTVVSYFYIHGVFRTLEAFTADLHFMFISSVIQPHYMTNSLHASRPNVSPCVYSVHVYQFLRAPHPTVCNLEPIYRCHHHELSLVTAPRNDIDHEFFSIALTPFLLTRKASTLF